MSKYVEFAVGWLQESKTKGQYVSAQPSKGNPAKGKQAVTLVAKFENGEEIPVTSFAMFFNENKKSEKAPDVQFVFSQAE